MFIQIKIHGLGLLPIVDENTLNDSSIPRLVSTIKGLDAEKKDVAVYISKEACSDGAPISIEITIRQNPTPSNVILRSVEQTITDEVTKYSDGRRIECTFVIAHMIPPERHFPFLRRNR